MTDIFDDLEISRLQQLLAPEYLTWLWCLGHEGVVVTLPDGRTVEIEHADEVILAPHMTEQGGVVTIRGQHTEPEVLDALRAGKQVCRASLKLVLDDEDYLVTLHAEEQRVILRRLPQVDGETPGERQVERVYLIEQILDALESLWGLYLSERVEAGGRLPAVMYRAVGA